MGRKPNPLLQEFLKEDLPLPELDWQTVPSGVNPTDAWEMFDQNVEGWVPVWFPTGDLISGKTFTEFERAYFFNDDLERILKAMRRWPLWGNPAQKKQAVAIALLHLYCEVHRLCAKV
jgi:hypothetical protein